MSKVNAKLVMLILILIPSIAPVLVLEVQAIERAVRVVPDLVVLGDASGTDVVGTEFSIAVVVEDITSAYGGDVGLSWNTTYFDYVGHNYTMPWNGTTLADTGPSPYLGFLYSKGFVVDDTLDTTAGTYYAAYASSGDNSFSGNGTICSLTLKVKTQPPSNEVPLGNYITLINDIYYSKIVDSTAADITPPVSDGTVHLYSKYVEAPPPPPAAKIKVDPEEIIDSTIMPCNNFTVKVNLQEVVDLYAFQFQLDYNTTILDTAEVTVNSTFTLTNTTISELQGQVTVNGSLEPPTASIDGDLMLASITFHTVDIGETTLDLHDVTLLNPSNETIDCEPPVDGYFNNMLKPKIYVDPDEITDPNLNPGSQFNISIKIKEVVGLYGYQFKLTCDAGVLNCLGVIIVPPTDDTHFTTEISCHNGTISVNVTYYEPAEPITIMSPKTIVTIYFQVKDYGCTDLDLHDTEIRDQYGQPIPHEISDGYFCTLIRDIAIVEVQPDVNATYPKRTVNIAVVASNLGDQAETFNVTAYYDSTPVGTQTVTGLLQKENITLTFIWNTTGVEPCNDYIIKAEAIPVPYEFNVTNNVRIDGTVRIKMLGDVNGDGIIDIADLTLICSIYRATEEDPEWNPQADLAPPYGLIDIVDVVTASSRYRQSCPS